LFENKLYICIKRDFCLSFIKNIDHNELIFNKAINEVIRFWYKFFLRTIFVIFSEYFLNLVVDLKILNLKIVINVLNSETFNEAVVIFFWFDCFIHDHSRIIHFANLFR
jgi:hypothetical protein